MSCACCRRTPTSGRPARWRCSSTSSNSATRPEPGRRPMHRIDAFLEVGKKQGGSDIHFTVGRPPLIRLDGELVGIKYRELTEHETEALVSEILSESQVAHLRAS